MNTANCSISTKTCCKDVCSVLNCQILKQLFLIKKGILVFFWKIKHQISDKQGFSVCRYLGLCSLSVRYRSNLLALSLPPCLLTNLPNRWKRGQFHSSWLFHIFYRNLWILWGLLSGVTSRACILLTHTWRRTALDSAFVHPCTFERLSLNRKGHQWFSLLEK